MEKRKLTVVFNSCVSYLYFIIPDSEKYRERLENKLIEKVNPA